MIVLTVTALLAIVSVATALALADNWIRGRAAFADLVEERALARAGFVPMVEAREVRLRSSVSRSRSAAARPVTHRAARSVRPAIAPLGEALGAA